MINLLVASVLIAFILVSQCTSHVDTVPLRGYTCKNNAQRPCRYGAIEWLRNNDAFIEEIFYNVISLSTLS